MLCATSPGECVGTPNSSQVCFVCSLDTYIKGWEPSLRQAPHYSTNCPKVCQKHYQNNTSRHYIFPLMPHLANGS